VDAKQIDALAQTIADARRSGKPMDVAGAIGGLSEADAYKVQFAVHDKICAGGAISLIDQVGVKTFVAECDAFAKKYGAQFEVPKLLRDMAAKGQSFYGNYHPAKAA
jgi:hypothetical protein